MTRYWKRWDLATVPASVFSVFRQNDGGAWQVWREGRWMDVPGEGFARLVEEGTVVDEITEGEAQRLGQELCRDQPLANG
jgi:hypothetical protein